MIFQIFARIFEVFQIVMIVREKILHSDLICYKVCEMYVGDEIIKRHLKIINLFFYDLFIDLQLFIKSFGLKCHSLLVTFTILDSFFKEYESVFL